MDGKTNDVVSEEVPSIDNSPRRTRLGDATDSQKEQGLERLKKIKNDPSRQVDLERLRKEITGSASTEGGDPGPDDKSLKPPPQKRRSLVGAWDAVLNASKVTINDKLDSTRKETNSPFKMTDGTGKVQSIIGEWEKLFVQKTATNEEVTNCVKGAQYRIKQSDIIWPNSPAKKNSAEMFEIGSTHVYKLEDLHSLSQGGVDVSPSVLLLEKLLADNSGRPLVLSSGVYGGKEGKPAISTTAIALIAEDGKAYIGLTVNIAKGHGYANDDTAYGVHKISVFLTNDTPGGDHLLSSIQLLQREINVVRKDDAYVSTAFDGYMPTDGQEIDTTLTDQESPMFERVDDSAGDKLGDSAGEIAALAAIPVIPVAAVAAVVASHQSAPVKIVDAPSPPQVPNLVTPTVSRPLPVKRLATPFPATPAHPTPAADPVIMTTKALVSSGDSPLNLVTPPAGVEVRSIIAHADAEDSVAEDDAEEVEEEDPDAGKTTLGSDMNEITEESAPAVVPKAAAAAAAVAPPQLQAVPNLTESWVPRTIKYQNRLYYWDPFRGNYHKTPIDIAYDPPQPKQNLVNVRKPSWVPRKPAWVPKNPFKAKKGAPPHRMTFEGVMYEWDERSQAYYPMNLKIDIRTKKEVVEVTAKEEEEEEYKEEMEESKGEVEKSKGEVEERKEEMRERSVQEEASN